MTAKFDFLPQARPVQDLLDICQKVMAHVPDSLKEQFDAKLREFEHRGTATSWSLNDVYFDNNYNLTEAERREALSRFLARYSATDLDWEQLEDRVSEVVDERPKHPAVRG